MRAEVLAEVTRQVAALRARRVLPEAIEPALERLLCPGCLVSSH